MTRFAFHGALALTLALSACGPVRGVFSRGPDAPEAAAPLPPVAAPETPEEIAAVVEAPPPPPAARTVDDFDTTTDAQKAAAQAEPVSEGARLGEVTASLGDPTDAGLWLKTTLVTTAQPGRIESPDTGKSATVELRPLDGDGGASISLAAMRLLEIPLTEIPTIVVYGQ